MQISVDYTLKLRLAVADVSRMVRHHVPFDIVELAQKFQVAPQGVSDLHFILGYNTDEGWVQGSIETDKNLQEYVSKFPKDWEIVKQCLGLPRQKSRHACFPSGVRISIFDEIDQSLEIEKCDQKIVKTQNQTLARATLLDQGIREVSEYTLANGMKLVCTPNQPFLTTKGWYPIETVFRLGLDLLEVGTNIL